MNSTTGELNTWQEIAGHLGISVREAQHREKHDGMPVYRLPGRKSRVFAYRQELDDWKLRVAVSPAKHTRRNALRGLGWGVGVAALAGGVWVSSRRPAFAGRIARATLVGDLLTAMDGTGGILWQHRFPDHVREWLDVLEARWRVQVVDLGGTSQPGVLVAAPFRVLNNPTDLGREELMYFSATGDLLWRRPNEPKLLDFNGKQFENTWTVSSMVVTGTGKSKAAWVAIKNTIRWASWVLRLDAAGNARIQFANSGNIERLAGFRAGSETLILAAGETNDYENACLAVFGEDDPPSVPPRNGQSRYRYANGPSGLPRGYTLFPASEVCRAEGIPYPHVISMKAGEDLVSVETRESADVKSIFEYEFHADLSPRVVRFSGSYPFAHEALEKRGQVDHSWANCPQRKRPVKLKRWEAATGWREIEIPWAV